MLPLLLAACASGGTPTADLAPTLGLRTLQGATVAFQNGMPVPDFQHQTTPRSEIDLDGSWRWQQQQTADDALALGARTRTLPLIVKAAGGRQDQHYDDGSWGAATVPGTFTAPPQSGIDGGWYRREFSVPLDWAGRSAMLRFGSVNYVADVWINGHYLGYHEGGATPFAFDVARWLQPGWENSVAVRVVNPPWGTRNDIVPWGLADWWNDGGMTSDVWLQALAPLHVVRADVTPHLDGADVGFLIANQTGSPATPEVTVSILPASVTSADLLDPLALDLVPAGAEPIAQSTQRVGPLAAHAYLHGDASFLLRSVDYWTPSDPALYVVRVTVTEAGRPLDQWADTFGLRRIQVDHGASRLLLNGRPVAFHGVDLQPQQQAPASNGNPAGGPVTSGQGMLDLVRQAEEVHADLIRPGHQPPNAWLPLLADRLGIGLWEEIPLYHETPQTFSIAIGRGIPQQMLVEMDLRDMNRPSVLFHGFDNESTGTAERTAVLTTLRDLDRRVDGTRLTGQAALGSDPADVTQTPLDVAGFTWYWGVFYGGPLSGELVARELERAHRANPGKPVMILEFGHWADDQAGEGYQAWVAQTTYGAIESRLDTHRGGYVGAALWWAQDDYWTERPSIGVEHFGLFRPDGTMRPAGRILEQAYAASSTTGAAPATVTAGGVGVGTPQGGPPWTLALSLGYALLLPALALLVLTGVLAGLGRRRRERPT